MVMAANSPSPNSISDSCHSCTELKKTVSEVVQKLNYLCARVEELSSRSEFSPSPTKKALVIKSERASTNSPITENGFSPSLVRPSSTEVEDGPDSPSIKENGDFGGYVFVQLINKRVFLFF